MLQTGGVPAVALVLVLGAAVLHATWNFLAKRSAGAGVPFVWLVDIGSAVLWTPVAVVAIAAIILISLFGLALYGVIVLLERVAMPWKPLEPALAEAKL